MRIIDANHITTLYLYALSEHLCIKKGRDRDPAPTLSPFHKQQGQLHLALSQSAASDPSARHVCDDHIRAIDQKSQTCCHRNRTGGGDSHRVEQSVGYNTNSTRTVAQRKSKGNQEVNHHLCQKRTENH